METVSTMQAEFADFIGRRPGRIGWARARYRRRPRSVRRLAPSGPDQADVGQLNVA